MSENEREIKVGDLVEITAVARVRGLHESGYTVMLHGELVPFLKGQCKLIPDAPDEQGQAQQEAGEG